MKDNLENQWMEQELDNIRKENEVLRKACKTYRDALEYYAKIDSWLEDPENYYHFKHIFYGDKYSNGYEIARIALGYDPCNDY